MKRIEAFSSEGSTLRPKPPAPSALTSLLTSALAIVIVGLVTYGVNLAGHYAESRGVSLKNALIIEGSLAGSIAILAACVWFQSREKPVIASWLCLGMLVRAAWSGWLLVKLLYPTL